MQPKPTNAPTLPMGHEWYWADGIGMWANTHDGRRIGPDGLVYPSQLAYMMADAQMNVTSPTMVNPIDGGPKPTAGEPAPLPSPPQGVSLTNPQREALWAIYSHRADAFVCRPQTITALEKKGLVSPDGRITVRGIETARRIR